MAALRRTSEPRLWRYVIALGSNQRQHRCGSPRAVLGAAVRAMAAAGLVVEQVAPVIESAPVGPSWRRYANGAAVVCSVLSPPDVLAVLHAIEAQFGRRRARRWGTRVLDLDIVLWEGGVWRSGRRRPLCVPHVAFRDRSFVLGPAMALVPSWRDPVTGFTLSQLHGRLTRAIHTPRGAHPGGIDRT